MGKKGRAAGCLRVVLVLALLCAIAVVGLRAVLFRIGGIGGGGSVSGSISDFVPSKEGYVPVRMAEADIYEGDLILVNQDAPYRFTEDRELCSLYDYKSNAYKVKDKNVTLDAGIIEPFNRMMDDFYARQHNHEVIVLSGYRSYDYQQDLLQNEIAQSGEAEAYRWVAQPGSSEHHTGLALDLGIYRDNGASAAYKGTGKYAWINENACRYGFIVRYDTGKKDITGISYEPWHFRYVGVPHAYMMDQMNLCLEEYVGYLRGYSYGEKHLLVDWGDQRYEIYFAEDTDVCVPEDKPYRISGNNVDGFIVTVTCS